MSSNFYAWESHNWRSEAHAAKVYERLVPMNVDRRRIVAIGDIPHNDVVGMRDGKVPFAAESPTLDGATLYPLVLTIDTGATFFAWHRESAGVHADRWGFNS